MPLAERSDPTPSAETPRAAVHATLVLVQLSFASLAVEGKLAMSGYGVAPSALAMARIVGAALVFVVAHLVLRTPRVKGVADMLRLAALSIFGIVANQALFLAGLRDTSPVAATLIVATIPVFAALIAAVAGRERLSARSAGGIALSLFGVGVLSHFALPARGDLFVLLNAASYAGYVVFAKGVLSRYGTITVVAWLFGAGALLFAPIGGAALAAGMPVWSPVATGLVAFIVLVPTILAYSANAWALRRATPTMVTIYIYVQPLVVALLAWVQLGQTIDASVGLASAFILAGVGLVATAPRPEPPRRAPS